MQLSPNFSLEELIRSDMASRLGINNAPTDQALMNLHQLAGQLEGVRRALGDVPLLVSSGYRCGKLNRVTPGSAPNSAHTLGFAADFTAPAFGSPLAICRALAADRVRFDQLIWEYEAWCHFSCDPQMRGLVLTKKIGQDYLEGLPPLT